MTAIPPTHESDSAMMQGKVAIISGGASGIGAACAEHLASKGVAVLIGHFAHDPHDASAVIERIRSAGGTAEACDLDVSDTTSTQTFINAAISHFGRLDYVVAAAGILRRATLTELDEAEWDALLSVDLGGVYRLFRHSAPHLTAGASLVSISSISGGVYGWADHAHYCAAKAGILGLTRATAIELAPRGIRANTVIPGIIETPQSLDETNSLGVDGLHAAAASIPLRRVGQPEEIARVVTFLLSDDASYLTAQELVVDGGITRVQ